MDVTLPSGRVLTDVPEGTTKAQIAAKVPPEWLMTPDELRIKETTPPVLPAPASAGSELNLDSSGQPIPAGMDTGIDSMLSSKQRQDISEQSLTPTRQNAAKLMTPSLDQVAAQQNYGAVPSAPTAPAPANKVIIPHGMTVEEFNRIQNEGGMATGMNQVPGWNLEKQFGAGMVNSLTAGLAGRINPDLGAAVAAPPQTGMEEVARGAGDLVGFLTGPGLQVAKGTIALASGLEHVAGESFVKALAKDVAAQSATLGLATGISATGQALDANNPADAAKILANASASGAGMGIIFGSFARILPDNTAAQIATRVLGVNATMDALNGTNPEDQRSLEKKLFDYGLNTFFALPGAGRTTGGWLKDAPATKAQQAHVVDTINSATNIDSAINAAHALMDEHGKSVADQLQAIRPLPEVQNGPANVPMETGAAATGATGGNNLGAGGADVGVQPAGIPAAGVDLDAAIRAAENAGGGNERGAIPVEHTGLPAGAAVGPEAVETNDQLGGEHAIPESSTSGVLQHAQEGIGETGGERQRVESGQQGSEATTAGNRPVGGTEGTQINIGLATNDGKGITADQVRGELDRLGISILNSEVKQSATEPTFVARLSRPLTEREATEVSANLHQEAIAQMHNGVGELYGPGAEAWKPFNSDYFIPAKAEQAPLRGLPENVEVDGKTVKFGPFQPAIDAARKYAEESGIPYNPPRDYVKVDPQRARRIAQAFEEMKHAPNSPEVKAAYDALIKETLAQWKAIKATGLKVEFFPNGKDTYGNPRNAIRDVVENNHLYVFPTEAGFGSGEYAHEGKEHNPLLDVVPGEKISGQPVRVNDIFRIVHDYFGHVKEGVGFRADGEENAWRQHMAMFSPEAQRALTSETRGQNSWVNFGPHAEKNRTASGEETQYAPQKIGLLPKWVSEEGAHDRKIGEVEPIVGTHFSKEQRPVLSGRMYGTGIRGAEFRRLQNSEDHRIKQRIAFYVNEGKGVFPEASVGNVRHDVPLTNLYDAAKNPLRLPSEPNAFESAVLDHGFDGYYVREGFTRQGVAVLLGDAAKAVKTEQAPAASKIEHPTSMMGMVDEASARLNAHQKAQEALGSMPSGMRKAATMMIERAAQGKRGGLVMGTEQDNLERAATELAKLHGTSVESEADKLDGQLQKSQSAQTETPEFKKWFGNSRIVDADGNPLIVYHGTTHDIEAFTPRISSVENDFGRGIYLTNNTEDVSKNYAGKGPDLTGLIETTAERIATARGWEYKDQRAFKLAEKKLYGGADNVMPLYVSMQNPLVLGGNETYMDVRAARKFINAVTLYIGSENKLPSVERALESLSEYYYDGGRASDLIALAKEALVYHENTKGDPDTNEMVRKAIERAGYDGIEDHTVSKKWGAESNRTIKMDGVNRDTVHYIAFKPEQVKSAIGNSGAFDTHNPSILFSRRRGYDIHIDPKNIHKGPGELTTVIANDEDQAYEIASSITGSVSHNGKDWQVITPAEVPTHIPAMSREAQVNGFYHPELGTTFINTDKVAAKDIPSVILHEVQHAADDPALNAEVMKRLKLAPQQGREEIAKSAEGRAPEFSIQQGFTITPEMRSKILSEGMPLFSRSGADLQNAKHEAKSAVQAELRAGRIDSDTAFRGTTEKELRAIANTGRLQLGENYEGNTGISAALVHDGNFPVYGHGVGYLVPKEHAEDSGYAGEVYVDPKTDPRALRYVVDGKVMSFDEMKDAITNLDFMRSEAAKQVSGDIYARVLQRMHRAGAAGDPREATSYLVEEAMKMGQAAGHSRLDEGFWGWAQKALPPSVVSVLKKWVANIRAALYKRGVMIQASDLRIDDFVAIAQSNMRDLAAGKREASYGSARASKIERPEAAEEKKETPAPSWLDSMRAKASDVVGGIVREIQLATTPMAAGSEKYRAIAKDYANAERLSRSQWARFDDVLKKNYTRDELTKMWEAADEQNVLLQQGKRTAGKGLDRLTPDQRKTMDMLHNYGEALLQRAKDVGMFQGEGLPYWTPRMAVMIGDDGEYSLPKQQGMPSGSGEGRNITVTASSLKQRKYLTTEETEAAMKAKLGEGAVVVKDIRAMPMAMSRLERAIAGRELIDQIKQLGKQVGEELVTTHQQDGYFTIDHPAFKTYRPKMVEIDGKMTPAIDQNGDMMMERNPLYMRNDLKGPLKAIMSEPSGKAYLALMALKGKVMSVVMYSPLIHNAVEYGRALPMLPGKMLTFQVYFEGNKAKHDPAQMREAIMNGMVPIGGHGGVQDITGIMEDPTLMPGRSLTAKAIGGVVGMANKKAGEAVKRGIDTAGDIWHNKLLWDRVGDLQMGLYTNIKRIETTKLVKAGMSKDAADGVAGKIAAHMANRYAGALPNEAMSSMSRKLANLTMFSRSFTVGNLGVMKDVFTGLPTDVQAQIKRDYGELGLRAGIAVARRKAIAAFIIDIGLMYALNSITQDAFDYLKRDKSLNDIEHDYADRFARLWHKIQENPLAVLNSPLDSAESLTTTSQNEPGKENRILYGYDKNGTAIYVRMPMGKIGEEFIGWTTSPLEMLKRKESTFLRPIIQTFTNDRGFGRQVYNPDEPGVMGAVHAAGKIALNFMAQQVPSEALQSLINTASDKGTEMDAYKVVGPLLGLTFSKGAPGGPAVGLMYRVEKERRARISDAMPDIKHDISAGDQDRAVQKMIDLGMTRNEIEMVLRNVTTPEAKLSSNALRRFGAHADEESKQRMEQLMRH